MFLIEAAVKRPIATTMAVLAVSLGGVIGIFHLPVDMMPNTESSMLTIFVGVRGGMPSEDIERLVAEPIEEAVATMSGLKEILSVSRKDRCTVTLHFNETQSVKQAMLEVSERLARIKGKLPREIEKPIVARYNENDHPVVILSATSSAKTPEMLRSMIEKDFKPELSRLPGVANVEISGGRQRKILVEFEKSKLETHTLPILEVIRQLGANNLSLMSGRYETRRDAWGVQFEGDFRTLDEMRELGVAITKEGSRIRLKDIAVVRDYYLEPESYSRINSRPAVTIYVQKESGGNTIKVAQAVVEAAKQYEKTLPRDVGLAVSIDQSVAIRKAIGDVRNALTEGAFLTALVLWLFLRRTKQVGVILLSIPIAVLGTFLTMFLYFTIHQKFGHPVSISINVMSLLGIALGIGRMVDDSIVVFENILHRFGEAAKKGTVGKTTIAMEATKEMALAVASSTLILVVIFVPIVFFSEEVRQQFADVAFTVVASLLASLVMAVTVVPLLASRLELAGHEAGEQFGWEKKLGDWLSRLRFLHRHSGESGNPSPLSDSSANEKSISHKCLYLKAFMAHSFLKSDRVGQRRWIPAFAGMTALKPLHHITYRTLLRRGTAWSVRNRGWVMTGVLFSLVFSIFIYVYKLPKEYASGSDKNEFIIFVELPSGSKLDVSDKVVAAVEADINAVPEVKNVVKTVSARVEGWSSKLYVTLSPAAERTRTVQDVIDTLRPRMKGIGAEYDAFIYFSEPESAKELVIDVFGKDYLALRDASVEIAKRLQEIPGLRDVKLRYKPGRPEVRLEVDHARASLFGLDSKEIADTIHAQVRGLRATYFNAGSEQVETVARLSEEDRRTLEHITNLTLVSRTKKKHVIPIQQVIEFQHGFTPSEVWRKNKERVIQVSANRERLALSTAVDRVRAALKGMQMPIGYHYEIGGDYKRLVESEREFTYAFVVMAVLVYMVLACFFESYSQPFLMLLTIPLATAGSMPALWLSKTSVNMGVYMGLLMLGGTVTSNAVILIDRLNTVRKTRSLFRSTLRVGYERSRPIFMTSLSTIAAMLPLTFGKGESADMWAPLALTVVSGIALSSVLTLFVIPAAYVMMEAAIQNWVRWTKGEVELRELISQISFRRPTFLQKIPPRCETWGGEKITSDSASSDSVQSTAD